MSSRCNPKPITGYEKYAKKRLTGCAVRGAVIKNCDALEILSTATIEKLLAMGWGAERLVDLTRPLQLPGCPPRVSRESVVASLAGSNR